LGAGQRIVERDLARRLKVSRIPLRESLVRLEAEGLIRRVPYSSTFVEDFEPADVLEIYSLRLLFEPFATRLLAQWPTDAILQRLEKCCERMTQASHRANVIALDRIDYEFHYTIVAACGHRRLRKAYENAHIRIVSSRTDYALLRSRPAELTAREHMQIVKKIRQRDPDGAERIARNHVKQSLRSLEAILRTRVKALSGEMS
jgi:DNA-binding GntR family transcriptional regulator